ncbi:MAG: ROK family transcriptional regulator [Hasllibacter sp.]
MEDGLAIRAEGLGALAPGTNQRGGADHNARLVLTAIQRAGALPAVDLARATGLTPQSVSGILRRLEGAGLVARGEPVRGKVGKPRLPYGIAPDGALALGASLGRRALDLVLTDLSGRVRTRRALRHDWPRPDRVLDFLARERQSLAAEAVGLGLDPARIAGLGIAAPSQLWAWHESLGAPAAEMAAWKGLDLAAEAGAATGLPVHLRNDATCAARAEHAYGAGAALGDYLHLYIGTFIGGGVVLGGRVFDGPQGNAGGIGPLRVAGGQLMDHASLITLEAATSPEAVAAPDWSDMGAPLDAWLDRAARALAEAALTACTVIDFEAVVLDGAMPAAPRAELVRRIRAAMEGMDQRGILTPRVLEGAIGPGAKALGAARAPLDARYFLDRPA